MFDAHRWVLSVPARELAANVPTASVFPFEELGHFTFSAELASALHLLREAFGPQASTVAVVARPEMFTHGSTLTWLFDRIKGTTHHLCLSDGDTVRIIKERQNHVFFYRDGATRCRTALRNLDRRAPELLGHLRSQVNTTHRFAAHVRTTIMGRSTVAEPGHNLLPFFTSKGGLGHDLHSLIAHDAVDLTSIPVPEKTTVVMCTEVALKTPAFMAALVADLLDAYLHPRQCLVMQAPYPDGTTQSLDEGVKLLLHALHQHAATLPSGKPSNVFVHLSGDGALPATILGCHSRLIAHNSTPFWQRPPEFYAPFSDVVILHDGVARLNKAAFRSMLIGLTGRTWLEQSLPSPERMPGGYFRW